MPTGAQGSLPREQQQAVPDQRAMIIAAAARDSGACTVPLVVTTAGYRSANQTFAVAEGVNGIFRDYNSICHRTPRTCTKRDVNTNSRAGEDRPADCITNVIIRAIKPTREIKHWRRCSRSLHRSNIVDCA